MGGVWLLAVLLFTKDALSQSVPNLCAFVKDTYFTCDYSGMVSSSDRPIDFASFSPEPQILDVTVNGFAPYFGDSEMFSTGWSGINVAGFDENYPATLTLDCGVSGSIYMDSGAFTSMGFVQHLKILNCNTYNLPSAAFADLGDLDYLGFEGGYIDVVDPNAMTGLNVEKLTTDPHSIPRNLGLFEIRYSKFLSQSVPAGLLYSWKNLTAVTLRGCDINTITKDVFSYNTKLKYIDLSDNAFTTIPSGLFNGLSSLVDFHAHNILWSCSCTNNWFVPYFESNNITMYGDNMCTSGVTVYKYYYDNCVTIDYCENLTGFTMGKQCVTLVSFTGFLFALFASGLVVAALVLTIIVIKSLSQQQERRVQAMGRWNKIIDSTMAWRNKK